MGTVQPPWTAALTQSEHDLVLFAIVVAGLALLATLVRVRFTSRESYGSFRVASLTANAVVAIAAISYVALAIVFSLGYQRTAGGYEPTDLARFAWALRYADWIVTVPLLVIELFAISAVTTRHLALLRRVGIAAAAVMVGFGYLGAFLVGEGRDLTTYVAFGVAGAVCFVVLYALFVLTLVRSLPKLPEGARPPYRAAVVLLLIVWLVYPAVYGFNGLVAGGLAAAVGQLLLSSADLVAKVGFGTLVHRTAVIRSRHAEDLDPSTSRRPRAPVNESIYVPDSAYVDIDLDG